MHRIDARWVAIAIFFLALDTLLIGIFQAGSDWAPLWAAGRLAWDNVSGIYDFDLIARLQGAVVTQVDFHPYIYPPSALLLVAPLALLPFWPSLALVAAGSLAWLAWTSRKVGSDPWLVLLAPPVAIAAIVGQTSLLVIGLVVLALSMLQKQEAKAGALLAVAALIKPTLLILAPIGLIAGRNWRALGAAALTGAAGIAISMLLFGIQPWIEWLQAIPRFQQLFADYPPLVRNAVSPHAAAVRLGLESLVIIWVGAIVAAILVWLGFSRPSSPSTRSALVMGGALLLTPYAMNYELAVFAPALLALPREQLRNVILVALWGFSLLVTAGVIGLLIAYLAVSAPLVARSR
jgi:hypothetical protein